MRKNIKQILQKIGEDIADGYEINWEYWDEKRSKKVEKEIEESINFYEEMMENISDIDNIEEDQNMLVDNLLSAYTIKSLLQRKKMIEEVINSSYSL